MPIKKIFEKKNSLKGCKCDSDIISKSAIDLIHYIWDLHDMMFQILSLSQLTLHHMFTFTKLVQDTCSPKTIENCTRRSYPVMVVPRPVFEHPTLLFRATNTRAVRRRQEVTSCLRVFVLKRGLIYLVCFFNPLIIWDNSYTMRRYMMLFSRCN